MDIAAHGQIGYVEPVLSRYRMHGNNVTTRGHQVLADQLMMMEIAEERYPALRPLFPPVRAECLWYNGLRHLAMGEHDAAGDLFRRSFRVKFRTLNVRTRHKAFIYLLTTAGLLGAAVPAYTLSQRAVRLVKRVMTRGGAGD